MLLSTVPKAASRQLLLAIVRFAVFLSWISAVAAKRGGGRGGGSSGGGGISFGGSRGGKSNNDCNGPVCAIVLVTIFGTIGLFLFLYGLYVLYDRYKDFAFAKKWKLAFAKKWKLLCSDAEKRVLEEAKNIAANGTRPVIGFEASSFRATYDDGSYFVDSLSSQGMLYFKNQASMSDDTGLEHPAKSISGSGDDRDGSFSITKGLVCMETGKAFWIEDSRETGISRLVTGHFSTDIEGRVTFTGSFICSNEAASTFKSFDVTPQVSPHDEGLEEDIAVDMTNGDYPESAIESTNNTAQFHVPSLFAAAASQEKQATLPVYDTHESAPRPTLSPSNHANDVPSIFRPPM